MGRREMVGDSPAALPGRNAAVPIHREMGVMNPGQSWAHNHSWSRSVATLQQAQQLPSKSSSFATRSQGSPTLLCCQPLLPHPNILPAPAPSLGTHGAGWLHPGLPIHLHGQQLGCPARHKEKAVTQVSGFSAARALSCEGGK